MVDIMKLPISDIAEEYKMSDAENSTNPADDSQGE